MHSTVNSFRINAFRIVATMHRDWKGLRQPHERLQWARLEAGFETPAEAAEALGFTGSKASTYFGHENGSRGLSRSGARYAEFFRVSFDWLMRGKGAPKPNLRKMPQKTEEAPVVQIIGRAGAGPGGSIEFSEGGRLGEAPAPPSATENTVALEVWGSSMRPIAYDGWLVYYDDRRSGLTPDMFGEPCVIGLADGHTVVKIPQKGSKRGLYNLESANPAVDTMRDQRVSWAALVTAFIPRRPAAKLVRQTRGEATF